MFRLTPGVDLDGDGRIAGHPMHPMHPMHPGGSYPHAQDGAALLRMNWPKKPSSPAKTWRGTFVNIYRVVRSCWKLLWTASSLRSCNKRSQILQANTSLLNQLVAADWLERD